MDRQTVEAYRQRWREINARPIKKVAEAKARKKRRVSGAVDLCVAPFPPSRVLHPSSDSPYPYLSLSSQMLKKMEQMKKKAEAVVSTVDISEREKVAQLRR